MHTRLFLTFLFIGIIPEWVWTDLDLHLVLGNETIPLFITALLLISGLKAQEQVIPYTQADCDRMARIETKVEALNKRLDDLTINMDSRFSDMNTKIDRLEDKFDSYFI